MYSSGYSQVSKSSPQAQKKMQYRSKGKGCGYYMRIVFFFSSLIQSLIIVSLVLFLVYGKSQDSASTSRIHDLEESFSQLSIENVFLRQQRKNLTNLLNTTLTEKARNDWDLANLRYVSNISALLIQDLDKKMQQCYSELFFCKSSGRYNSQCAPTSIQLSDSCNCGLLVERLKARLELVESNFTQTTHRMRMELDQTAKERDNLNLEVIRLRRERATHEKEVDFFRQKCRDDFSQSLSGISNVSKAFLDKIDSLFSAHTPFLITCVKQREHLEQIRTNCTSLSLEVEDKFQRYLNNVGGQVSKIQGENSRLKAENWRLSEDYRWCSTNRTGLILQNRQNLDKMQRKTDEEKERLLMDKMRLNGEIDVLKNSVKYKSREVDHLNEQLKHLNMSCMFKGGFGGLPGGMTPRLGSQSQPAWGLPSGGGSSSYGISQNGRAGSGGFGSYGSVLNKPSTGAGSSLFSTGSGSSSGSAYNKPSTGSGSSLFSLGSSSSSGSTYNKPSTGSGSSLFSSGSSSSSGSTYNKPSSTSSTSGSSSSSGSTYNKPSTGSSSSSSSLFSSGSSSSSGSTYNKPSSTSSTSGSSSSSGSTYNKPGSTSSTSGSSSSSGSTYNKPGSTSLSSGSSGSSVSKPASSGGFFSGFGSSSSSSSSSGTALNKSAVSTKVTSPSGSSGIGAIKPTTNVKSPTSSGSSSGSTGSTSKSGSGGLSWFGFGGSSSGQSKTGSGTGTGKGPSTGNSYGGPGSPYGAGRTSGLGGGPISVAQHLRDLQRLINPSDPQSEEKQGLSRVMG